MLNLYLARHATNDFITVFSHTCVVIPLMLSLRLFFLPLFKRHCVLCVSQLPPDHFFETVTASTENTCTLHQPSDSKEHTKGLLHQSLLWDIYSVG